MENNFNQYDDGDEEEENDPNIEEDDDENQAAPNRINSHIDINNNPDNQRLPCFDINDLVNLNVPSDVKELLSIMKNYKPQELIIDTKLKPFIPDYIPAIGEVDAFLKIPRPDNYPEEIGLNIIDEPTINGIDPTIFSLELSYKFKFKTPTNMHVKSVENAEKNPKLIQNWINQISELHKEKMSSNVNYSKPMPDIESLMQIWPDKMETILKEITFPGEGLNITIINYAKLVCNMLDIPIHQLNNNKGIIEALHILFTLYSEFKDNQHFQKGKDENVMKFY